MLKVLKYFIMAAFAAMLAAYFVVAQRLNAAESEEIVCNNIDITIMNGAECDFIHEDYIVGYLTEQYGECSGLLIDEINCARIEELIKGISAIKGCECYTDRDGRLSIDVYQREPAIRFETSEGAMYSDAEGFIFPVQGSHFPKVTVVTGDIPLGNDPSALTKAEKDWLGGILELNGYIAGDGFWSKMITQIAIEENGDIVLIPQIGDFRICFGPVRNIDNKFYRLEKFYETIYPSSEGIYREVSVKYDDQIVCKKKNTI